jgi:hypothetical protein
MVSFVPAASVSSVSTARRIYLPGVMAATASTGKRATIEQPEAVWQSK